MPPSILERNNFPLLLVVFPRLSLGFPTWYLYKYHLLFSKDRQSSSNCWFDRIAPLGKHYVTGYFPPGTSKWNKIEHRMFCKITKIERPPVAVSMDLPYKGQGRDYTANAYPSRAKYARRVSQNGILP